MEREGHIKFGEVFNRFFNTSVDVEWAVAPDYPLWFGNEELNHMLHRFTLHGVDNVFECMKIMQNEDIINFEENEREAVETLVLSHSFLDLFNGPIIPSYPNSREFNFIFSNLHKYPVVCLSDPPLLEELFREIFREEVDELLSDESRIISLNLKMRNEFKRLPWEKGSLTERILEHYKKYS